MVDFRAARARAEHPAALAARRSFAAVPAPLLRWGVAQFDPMVRSSVVTGNTVVSSVNRGPADLRFGDAPVLLGRLGPTLRRESRRDRLRVVGAQPPEVGRRGGF